MDGWIDRRGTIDGETKRCAIARTANTSFCILPSQVFLLVAALAVVVASLYSWMKREDGF